MRKHRTPEQWLALVDQQRNSGLGEQLQSPAKHDELSTHTADGIAIILSEVCNRLEIRCQTLCQPHQLDIALRLVL